LSAGNFKIIFCKPFLLEKITAAIRGSLNVILNNEDSHVVKGKRVKHICKETLTLKCGLSW